MGLTVADVPVRHPDAHVARLAPHADVALPARAHPAALVGASAGALQAVHAPVADLRRIRIGNSVAGLLKSACEREYYCSTLDTRNTKTISFMYSVRPLSHIHAHTHRGQKGREHE